MTVRTKRRNEACPLDPDCFVQLTTSKKHWPDINAKPPNDPNQAADRTSSERYPAISEAVRYARTALPARKGQRRGAPQTRLTIMPGGRRLAIDCFPVAVTWSRGSSRIILRKRRLSSPVISEQRLG